LFAGCALAAFAVAQAEEKPLGTGERIVFLGDSITQAGAGPHGYVTLVRQTLDRDHKSLGAEVIGAGISGNKVPDLEKRLERDVLSKKPTIVIIYIGINDVWHSQSGRGTSQEDFEKGLRSILSRIRDAGARPILCTASVIGEKTDGTNSLDKMLDEYCEISRKVAADTKTQLIDLHQDFASYLKQHNPQNKDKGVLTTDGVHLNEEGNKFVAREMLAALNVPESKSASVLRHVVLFKFKDDVSKAQVQEVVDAFRALPSKIDAVKGFEFGTDNSPEMKADGFTHCFFLTFADEKGRAAYLPHPAHEEFKKLVGPRVDKVLVVDYWTQE
jgi:lysophospholipase L1-like esterase